MWLGKEVLKFVFLVKHVEDIRLANQRSAAAKILTDIKHSINLDRTNILIYHPHLMEASDITKHTTTSTMKIDIDELSLASPLSFLTYQ